MRDVLKWSLIVLLLIGLLSSGYAKPAPDKDTDGDNDDSDEDPDNPDDSVEDRDEDKDGEEDQSLLLILMDGFRYDYTENCEMFGFKKMEAEGVHAPYMEPIFPSLSYPNYYALTTGRYAESHGMVGNFMYDPKLKDVFHMLPHENGTRSHWWDDAEPIWITATRANRKASLYRWPGCQVDFDHIKPFHCVPYTPIDGVDDFKRNLDNAVTDIKDKGVRLAMVYVEYADKAGHDHGPRSKELVTAVRELDEALMDLLKDLENKKIADDVNVIVVSDHGMQDTYPSNIKEIELPYLIEPMDLKFVIDTRAYVGIYPLEGRMDKVYKALKGHEGMHVYKKENIPEKYHLKDNPKTPPLILIAKNGYYIEGFENTPKQIPAEQGSNDSDNDKDGTDDDDPTNFKGTHGYDPDEVHDMRGIFYATGPAFKSHYEGDPISIVDLYNVMSDIIDVKPLPNNGSMSDMEKYLDDDEDDDDDDDNDDAQSTVQVSLVVALMCWLITRIFA